MFKELVRSVIVTDVTVEEGFPMLGILRINSGELAGEEFVIYDTDERPLQEGAFVINFFREGLRRRRYIEAWRGEKILTYLGPLDDAKIAIGR